MREKTTGCDIRTEELVADFQRSDFLQAILRAIDYHAASEHAALTQENERLRAALSKDHAATEHVALTLENERLRASLSREALDPPGFMNNSEQRLSIRRKDTSEVGSNSHNFDLVSSIAQVSSLGERGQLETTAEERDHPQNSGQSNGTIVHTEARVHGPSDCWHGVVMDVPEKRASESTHHSNGQSAAGLTHQVTDQSSLIPSGKKHRGQPRNSASNNKGRFSVLEAFEQSLGLFKQQATKRLSLGGAVFADIDDMKRQVQLALLKKPYDVAEYYKEVGCCQYIARHQCFEIVQLFVISVNSIWIAVDVDVNGSNSLFDSHAAFIAAEFGFFTFFTVEWIIRFGAFQNKHNCLRDTWFVFDSMLLALMFLDVIVMPFTASGGGSAGDTSVLKLLRLTRLVRMGRMAHLLKAMPELTILLKAIGIAARSVFYTLILLTIVIYIFSVGFRHLTDGTAVGEKFFPSVPYGMKALLLYGILPDIANVADELGADDAFYLIAFLVFILMGSLTVMNMLVGVLVEVVSVVSHLEKEQLKVTTVKQKLFDMLNTSGLAADEDMIITRPDFESLLVNPSAARVIHEVGVDPVALVEFTDHIFSDVGKGDLGLNFESFIGWILALRGSNNATVKDVVDLRQFIIQKMSHLEEMMAAYRGQPSVKRPTRSSPSASNSVSRVSASISPSRCRGVNSSGFGHMKGRPSEGVVQEEESILIVETLGTPFSPVVPERRNFPSVHHEEEEV